VTSGNPGVALHRPNHNLSPGGLPKSSLLTAPLRQLGMLTKLTGNFDLHANSLCEGLPTEVAALSNMVQYEWKVTTGNEDLCGTYDDDGRGGASKDGGRGGSKISDVGAVLISGGSMVTVLALAWIARRVFGSVPISDGDTVSTCELGHYLRVQCQTPPHSPPSLPSRYSL